MAQKRKKNRLPLILGIIAILAFAGMAFAKKQGWVGEKILTKVATEKIERRQIIETVSANGKIYPEAEVSLVLMCRAKSCIWRYKKATLSKKDNYWQKLIEPFICRWWSVPKLL